jgi:DNA-binding transcriptional LysR family regulator
MGALESICRKAKLSRGAESGEVRVAGFRSVATHILPEVIQQFHAKYPGVRVSIEEHQHSSRVEDDLRQGRADIGFTYLPTRPEFETWELMHDRYVVLLPPGDPVPQPFTWDDLASYPLIMRPNQDDDRRQVERHMAACGKRIQPAYSVKEDSTILSMVKRGLGATVMARLAAEPIPEGIRVVEMPTPLERVISVVMLKDALHPPPVFAFLDTLQKVWQQSPLALQNNP